MSDQHDHTPGHPARQQFGAGVCRADHAQRGQRDELPGADGERERRHQVPADRRRRRLSTMADGTQTYLFSFGPLSGLADIATGKAGTQFPNIFNSAFPVSTSNYLAPGDPATTIAVAPVGAAP